MRVVYSRWDGTQIPLTLEATEVFDALSEELIAHGDLDGVLRRALQMGITTPSGKRVPGIRHMLEQLRTKKRELLASKDASGIVADILSKLQDVIALERAALDRDDSPEADERALQLDLLPEDPAGRIRELMHYPFVSPQAERAFQELMEELRSQTIGRLLKGLESALANPDPAEMERARNAMHALATMIEQHDAGEELNPSFEEFMENYGDLFPGNPSSLEELLEELVQSMAAWASLMASLDPSQRQELSDLLEELLGDLDLSWAASRLGQALSGRLSNLTVHGFSFEGTDPLGLGEALDLMAELGELDGLERQLSGLTSPNALDGLDFEKIARLLGPEAADALAQLSTMTESLQTAGLLDKDGAGARLTPKALRRLGQRALEEVNRSLAKERQGEHQSTSIGTGQEREGTTQRWLPGDPLNLNIGATVSNAVKRNGPGVPVRVSPEDFEVDETSGLARVATVLALDLSLSMPMRGSFVPAKKVAMAMQALISSKYRGDFFAMVGFSDIAREIKPRELPEATWDYVHGTNMAHALAVSRGLLASQRGTKQVLLVTDGEPTAHLTSNGEVFFNYPPARSTIEATLLEVRRCTNAGIKINVFLLDPSPLLHSFMAFVAKINGGKVFVTDPEDLGRFVMVDYLENRRSFLGRSA